MNYSSSRAAFSKVTREPAPRRRNFTRGLPKTVESLCPECSRSIDARLYGEKGKVMMKKECPEHGEFVDIYWSDEALYLKAEKWFFEDGPGLDNPLVGRLEKCPRRCGLCEEHTSFTCLGNIDLTNRCNLSCPVCFANANVSGRLYEPSSEQVVEMLRLFRTRKPVPGVAIQFSGGEPTLHPDFFEIIEKAREMGFSHIQIATNGLKLADAEFCHQCAEAGLHSVYLQFDGTSDEVYEAMRGRPLMERKLEAIDNIRKTGMYVVLVPTIINGINDHEVGKILEFTLKNTDVISGISYQPVALT